MLYLDFFPFLAFETLQDLRMEQAIDRLVSLTIVVELQEDRLALVHIPLDLYPFFLDPILKVLFHEVAPITERQNAARDCSSPHEDSRNVQPAFLNLSITPVECSVTCPRQLADEYFAPLLEQFFRVSSSPRSRLSISSDDFIAMQVYGEGLEAGQRVLELTTPLAMAGMYVQALDLEVTDIFQLHLFHIDIFCRLYHCSAQKQVPGHQGSRKSWIQVRNFNRGFHQQQPSVGEQSLQPCLITLRQHLELSTCHTSPVIPQRASKAHILLTPSKQYHSLR